MNKMIIFLLLLNYIVSAGQPIAYTVANLHSHNDYEKPFPFYGAYHYGYGSIEADIFLKGQNLILAHDTSQLKMDRTLDSFYLKPLERCIKTNHGFPYANHSKNLQLLIDIKTDSFATLKKLVEKLQTYPMITACTAIKIVITGNRPAISSFADYPSYIYFDGELNKDYPPKALNKIEMLSDNFRTYSWWNGTDTIPMKEKIIIEGLIAKAHRLRKKVRFWNAPDIANSWTLFKKLGVDYINTDHIELAAVFLGHTGLY